jgi:hypothetical protein
MLGFLEAQDSGAVGIVPLRVLFVEHQKAKLVFGGQNGYPKDAVMPNTLLPRWREATHP